MQAVHDALGRPAPSLERPLPAEWKVHEGRDRYLAENGFTVAAYSDKWTPASLFGIAFSVPNTPRHAWAIKLHDLHHVATGFGTDLTGESEISAWEARRGLRSLGLYTGMIVFNLAIFGLLHSPRRTLRAWRISSQTATPQAAKAQSLFGRSDLDYDALLAMSVAELRAELQLPPHGIAGQPRRLHALAPQR